MPLINLIQEQRLAVKRDETRARSYFFGFIGIGILSVGGYLSLLLETEHLQGQEMKMNADIQRVKPLLAQKDANDKQYQDLSPRVKTLGDAQLITARWDRLLNHLSKQTPEHTWMTGLRCTATDPEKPIAISFIGIGTSQEPIGELILRLQNSQDLEEVQLKYTQEKMINMDRAVEFEIDADIAGTADKKDAVKKEAQS